MRFLIISLFFLTSYQANADRSISISVPKGSLELTNPSAVTVTYTAECYDKVTGANIVTGHSNATIATKKGVSIANFAGCAAGATLNKALSQGPIFCGASTNYADAASKCGAASHMCSIGDLITAGVVPAEFIEGYYLKPHDSTTAWYSTYDSWGKNSTRDTSLDAPYTYMKNTGYQCSLLSSGNNSGNSLTYCGSGKSSSTKTGTVCCPDNAGFVSCKVTIHGAAASAGHLQSPQYKGGAPF